MEIYTSEKCDIDRIKIEEIKCSKCDDNIFLNFDNYKINLHGCKNGHKKNKISFNSFMKTQKSNPDNFRCENCNKKYTDPEEQRLFALCLSCKKKLCLFCKKKHNNNHQIIENKYRNYICNIHDGIYHKYCIDCKKNLCVNCEEEHHNHNKIDFKDIIPNINNLSKTKENLKKN